MAFCKNCGQEIKDDAAFCNSCGAPVSGAAPVYTQPVVERTDYTSEFDSADVEDTRILAALCYVFNFAGVVIALLIRPNSKFIKFHVNQSLTLTIVGVLAGIVAIIPFLGWLVGAVVAIVCFVFMWIGFARALGRRAAYLPLIGKYKVFDWQK